MKREKVQELLIKELRKKKYLEMVASFTGSMPEPRRRQIFRKGSRWRALYSPRSRMKPDTESCWAVNLRIKKPETLIPAMLAWDLDGNLILVRRYRTSKTGRWKKLPRYA
jgi:hypothetical protein